ncbi:hypothetical protein [Leuconostoc mesenteroides]|uniref:hypothetical protein n=1 Tax=Leuconostoc mesenteroides TaxID=1245 RepID=UPI001C23BD58|nr:hypothetical protein [Leuconostoc mesenteroides]QXC53237.1 hypothetical protein EZV74_00220 [Leuconostoc mesenteroides]
MVQQRKNQSCQSKNKSCLISSALDKKHSELLTYEHGQIIGANLSGRSEIVGSEIQVFPLGFTLVELNGSEKEKNINSGLDITNWFNEKDCQHKKEFFLRTYIKSQPFPYYISGVIP